MSNSHWIWLLHFMAGVLAVALYGLTASGHFPSEARREQFKQGSGAVVLWSTLAATLVAAAIILFKSWSVLPWYLSLLGGGGVLLFAPMLLQPLPDSFVDGRRGLLVFSACAVALAGLMWIHA
jgi:hypothetical protein